MEKYKGSIYLIGGFALAGTSVIAARFVSESLGTFTITAVSLFFTILSLLPLCSKGLRKTLLQMKPGDWVALVLQATCGIFLFRMFLIQGLAHTSAGEAGILTGATPAATAVLAVFLLKERLSRKILLGILLTVAGIVLLQGLSLSDSGFSRQHFIGNLLVLCAAGCEALFNVFSRFSSQKVGSGSTRALEPAAQTLLVATIAFLLCLLPAIGEQPLLALRSLRIQEWLALLWYGIFVTSLAFIFFYAGIRRCRASTAAVFSGMMPFTALILSVLLLGETAGWQEWSGGSMIVLGMVLIGGSDISGEETGVIQEAA